MVFVLGVSLDLATSYAGLVLAGAHVGLKPQRTRFDSLGRHQILNRESVDNGKPAGLQSHAEGVRVSPLPP